MVTPSHLVCSCTPLLTTNLFSLAPISYSLSFPLNKSTPSNYSTCSSTSSDDRSTFRFDPQDDDNFYEQDFGSANKRNWWSDYDYDDDDFEFDVDEDDELWVFKILRAFGWMLPAIAISLLLGTGPNAFIMALAVPLGQSALSFVTKNAWAGSRNRKPKPKTRTKKKPFARAASGMKTSEREEANTREDDSQSWVGNSYTNGVPRYGGWDELGGTQRASRKTNGLPKLKRKERYNKMGRIRDTPLFMRLLIAVFPFLGSWTKLFL